jgi:hypothetical protein
MAERFSEFDPAKASEALHAEPQATRDVAYGQGHTISVGETTLEVYQAAGLARVTTPDQRFELFRVATYHVSPDRLVFQQGEAENRTRLLVRSNGRVSFYPVSGAAESSRTQQTAPPNEMASPAPTDASTPITARPDNASGADPEHQEPVQLQLTGRLGRDPWFSDQDGAPTAGFPLAVNEEGGKTTWHRVVVFGEVAEQVRTGLKKGRLVQLRGSEVVRSESTAKGGTRRTTEIHAANVARVQNRPAPHPQA